ncbi:MAG TPA: glycosyltransferase family 4 protein [Hanamia sp.]|nr:glycosyltransferase family 4 protein [Hanamia sp.]
MKICFWGDIATALTDNTSGGAELQMALIAKALARGGHEVVLIDYQAKEDSITADGIKIFRIEGWNKGIRVIRTFTHRLPKLYHSLKEQKADVYYCRIRDFRHILAFWAARKVKGKFVLGLASDLDAMSFTMRFKYQHLAAPGSLWSFSSSLLIEVVYPYLLRKADLVLVQHGEQKELLSKKNISSKVLLNLIDTSTMPVVSTKFPHEFIYVGYLDKRKRIVDFFELVTKTPSISYKVVGQPGDKTGLFYYDKLKQCKNVILYGKLSHSETMYHIANSKALISTSPMEGFPNIFIEAWASGIPVFSLYFDPGVIEKENLGKVSGGNLDVLIKAMETPWDSSEFSMKAKKYVEHNHVLNADKIEEINSLFSNL